MLLKDLQRSKVDGSLVQGYCRLTEFRRQMILGEEMGVLRIEDASGANDHIIATDGLDAIAAIPRPGLIKIKLKARPGGLDLYASLIAIREAAIDEIRNGAAMLPGSWCSREARDALLTLVDFNESIPNTALKSFLTGVLLDPNIGIPLLTATASRTYHHAQPGGLLIHSTDLLKEAGDLARKAFPDSDDAVTVTQLGYLFHDLGKVITHAAGSVSTDLRHEFMTLQLLGPHLRRLMIEHPHAATALQLILEHCALPAKHRGIAKFVGADIVIWCDQLSTARDHGVRWGQLLGRPAMNDPITVPAVIRRNTHG